MAMPHFADPKNLIVEEPEPEMEIVEEGPEGETSLQLLQAIYRDKGQPLNVRVRCAIEALVHEYPKKGTDPGWQRDGKSFAEMLERAIERSKQPSLLAPNTIEHEPLPAEELKRPFSNYRNNYRRY
jgi:hypothetical protein